MKTLSLVCIAGLLIACGNPTKTNNVEKSILKLSDSINIEHSDVIEQTQNSDYLKIVGDSVEIPYFEIELKLSNKAEDKLKTNNETVILMAYFEGITNFENIPDKYKDRIDGGFHLLSYPIELTDKRLARFENIKFSKDLYDFLENKDIRLLINVFSGRKSSEFNLLHCDILEGFISEIKGKRFTINGKLIYDDD